MACPNDPDCSPDCRRPEREEYRKPRVCPEGHLFCDRLYRPTPDLTPQPCKPAARSAS